MRFAGVLAVLMLAGCVALGAKDAASPSGAAPDKAPKPNPIFMSEITTTSLDAPASEAKAPDAKPPEPKPAEAAPPAKADEKAKAQAGPPEEAAEPAPAAPPPEPKSPAEAKCLKSGGLWADAGKSGAKSCIWHTRDAGKACSRQTQCEGYCLARSHTCAPITPMFGCNDILQADGRAVTLCLD